ncbi:M14 metallopeptidase family protein [Eudoraea chungangensis]|uniref:M14 metallopeptidase family protein n=1 Tax=Eudoraea chungangensis TaxID=1481905 RepID=UPI0023ECF910|nr:M14 metallopeptidase family protein [Eudoraea chungangensis]
MYKITFAAISLVFCLRLNSQELQSPSAFLGYELGTRFTPHHRVVDYYEYLAKTAKDRMHLMEYGKTYEYRPLYLAFISSSSNMKNLEEIRKTHIANTEGKEESTKAIVWMSYNVHGNESVSTEASMQTIFDLLTSKSNYLENTVVIMDPCINPDGRERYVNWYNQHKNTPFETDPNSKEHHEGWWSGRSNHYMFDLNRDWAWLTQKESQQRLPHYQKWLPHIHVDFHEQGVDSPYYFAPAAEPFHEVITDFQREFQITIGKNHAKYFDAKGWFYFTKERFDLFYPSYGDTYPMYSGGIGMTYEQGGSGRAGLGVLTSNGDTLTLKDRIAHHYTTGMSTVEVASNNIATLNSEIRKFYMPKNFQYNSYVLSGNKDQIRKLTSLIKKHQIEYSHSRQTTAKGFNYSTGKTGNHKVEENSIVINTRQKKSTLVKVLFEPNAVLSDSLTYDITAWSLPYAYGLNAIATNAILEGDESGPVETESSSLNTNAYAYVTDWNGMDDARFLTELMQNKFRVRSARQKFVLQGKSYNPGTLIITKGDNEHISDLGLALNQLAKKHFKNLEAVATGFVDSGKDFGSEYVKLLTAPKIAILGGEPTSTLRFGEIWHFLEQDLKYPMTVLDSDYFSEVNLETYDILILPDGDSYGNFLDSTTQKKIDRWVKLGGKLLAMGSSLETLAEEDWIALCTKTKVKDSTSIIPETYRNIAREEMKDEITGAIFKVLIDNTHPMAFGYDNLYFTLKEGNSAYEFLDEGTVAYIADQNKPVSGFAGSNAQREMANTLIYGVQERGDGAIIYMVDNPLFRGFWENGKLFFVNSLFMLE